MSADNKKEKDVSKVDFDFSGISGEKRKKTVEKPVKKKETIVTGADDTKRGITLSFKTETGWDHKDIADVTPEEFLSWAAGVYPAEINVSREKLEKTTTRVTIFKKILHYHTHSPFQMGKQELGKKKEEPLPN